MKSVRSDAAAGGTAAANEIRSLMHIETEQVRQVGEICWSACCGRGRPMVYPND